MKVTFAQKDLLHAAGVVQNIVNPMTSLAILRNVLVEPSGKDAVTFFASDLEAYARVTVPAKVEQGGRVTLPARTFGDIVKELPASDVAIATKGTKASIRAEGVDYQLATMPADDFPEWPDFKQTTAFVVSQSTLREALAQVSCAIPSRDPRKVLLGACFDLQDTDLRLVATDGKKLVLAHVAVEGVEGEKARQIIVPAKMVNEILRHLNEAGTVTVRFAERQVAFELANVLYVSNIIEGQFPRYELVIPKAFERKAVVSREALQADLRRASLVQDKNDYGITLKFSQNALSVTARGQELGTYEASLAAEYEGAKFDIIFNYSFLQELLKAAGGSKITIKMNAPSTPAVMIPDGREDSVFLLMPIKASDYEKRPEVADDDDDDDAGEDDDARDA